MKDDVAGSAAEVEHRAATRRREQRDRTLAPTLVHSGREYAIGCIVARRDLRKHIADEGALICHESAFLKAFWLSYLAFLTFVGMEEHFDIPQLNRRAPFRDANRKICCAHGVYIAGWARFRRPPRGRRARCEGAGSARGVDL